MTQAPLYSTRPQPVARLSRHAASLSPLLLWIFPAFMLATIVAVFGLGVRGTWLSAPLLALVVVVCSLRGQWLAAAGFYFTYAALEGMYKYTTGFSSTIYVIKPLLVIIMAFVWWIGARESGKRLQSPPFMPLLVCLGCIGFVQAFNPLGSGFVSSLAAHFLWYIAPIFFYFLFFNEVKTAAQLRNVLLFLFAISTLVSVFGVFQYAVGQKWLEEHLAGYARVAQGTGTWFGTNEMGQTVNSFRPASSAPHPVLAATWSFIGIMISCSYILSAEIKEWWKQIFMTALLFINSVALLATGVRLFVFISIICIALLLLFTMTSVRQVVRNLLVLALLSGIAWGGFIVGEIFSGGILTVRYASTFADPVGKLQKDRGANYGFLPYFLPKYPLGIGFQRGVGDVESDASKAAHTVFLDRSTIIFNRETQFNSLTADLGFPGLLVLCALIFGILRMGWKTLQKREGPSRIIGALIFVILIGHIISFFAGPLLQSADHFWLLLALLSILPAFDSVSWQNQPEPIPQPVPPRPKRLEKSSTFALK